MTSQRMTIITPWQWNGLSMDTCGSVRVTYIMINTPQTVPTHIIHVFIYAY